MYTDNFLISASGGDRVLYHIASWSQRFYGRTTHDHIYEKISRYGRAPGSSPLRRKGFLLRATTNWNLEWPLVCSLLSFIGWFGSIVDVYYILFVVAFYDDKQYLELLAWRANIDDYVGYEEAGSFRSVEEKMSTSTEPKSVRYLLIVVIYHF